jgi:uncharacterized protein
METDHGSDWRRHLITDTAAIRALLVPPQRIAVLGIKPAETDAPAYYVPEHAQRAGFTILPVPVYYPEMTEVLGARVYRSLRSVPPPIDIVQVFRKPADIPQHLDDLLGVRPRVVWMQLGITEATVAEALARAGINVVQDRCMLVELKAIGR